MKSLNAILLESGKEAKQVTIDGTLENLQRLVDGAIEIVSLAYDEESGNEVVMVCNDEGKLNGSLPNRCLKYDGEVFDIVFGDAVIVGYDEEGNERSLTNDEINKYLEEYKFSDGYEYIIKHF